MSASGGRPLMNYDFYFIIINKTIVKFIFFLKILNLILKSVFFFKLVDADSVISLFFNNFKNYFNNIYYN
jgi:hypothetical protein